MDLNISSPRCSQNDLELNGEISKIVIRIWTSSCGTEKLIEHKNYLQASILWCLDYVSWWPKNILFINSWKLINDFCAVLSYLLLRSSTRSLYTYLFLEITRILNHLLAIQRMLWMLVLWRHFWAFEEREKLMEFYERVSVHECIQLLSDQGA